MGSIPNWNDISTAVPKKRILANTRTMLGTHVSIPTIIVGDFNADALNKNDAGWKKLSLVSAGVGLRNCINEPTRICPSSSTCLDLLLTNLDESPACEVIETLMSDHQMIIRSVPIKVVPHACSPLQTTRDLKRIEMAVFLDLLWQKKPELFPIFK